MEKTNVMRILERNQIPYRSHEYEGAVKGEEVASLLGEAPEKVFKTLVTVGQTKKHYVFMIPVGEELDLKKAAKAAHEKSIVMLPQKELFPLTGYVHGGCSPIGMKKAFPTFIHSTAADLDTLFFSAGKIGAQVELPLEGLRRLLPVEEKDLIVEERSSGSGST